MLVFCDEMPLLLLSFRILSVCFSYVGMLQVYENLKNIKDNSFGGLYDTGSLIKYYDLILAS
jgi:hypothetical protein